MRSSDTTICIVLALVVCGTALCVSGQRCSATRAYPVKQPPHNTAAAAAAAAGRAAVPGIVKIPLKQKQSYVAAVLSKEAPKIMKRQISRDTTVDLFSYRSVQYYGDINVGVPPNMFQVLYDTGSSDLWLPVEGCGLECFRKPKYHPEDSNASYVLGNPFTTHYGSGSVSGTTVIDRIDIGGYGVCQVFGMVNDVSAFPQYASTMQWDGVCGMGWPALSATMAPPPIFSLFFNYPYPLLRAEFAFSLPHDGSDGELHIGNLSLATSLFIGGLVYTPLSIEATTWSVDINYVKYDGVRVDGSNVALVDSGTSVIVAPPDVVDIIFRATNATSEGIVDCHRVAFFPTLRFTINQVDWVFTGHHYVYRDDVVGACALGIGRTQGPDDGHWILGSPWLRRVFTIFDAEDKGALKFAYSSR